MLHSIKAGKMYAILRWYVIQFFVALYHWIVFCMRFHKHRCLSPLHSSRYRTRQGLCLGSAASRSETSSVPWEQELLLIWIVGKLHMHLWQVSCHHVIHSKSYMSQYHASYQLSSCHFLKMPLSHKSQYQVTISSYAHPLSM